MRKTELKIEITESGEVLVTGPVDNKMVAYAMLELARDAIKDLHDRCEKEKKISIVGSLPPMGG